MNLYTPRIRIFVLATILFSLYGCATPPIQREVQLSSGDPRTPSPQAQTGRVVFVNEILSRYNHNSRSSFNAAPDAARDIAVLAGVGQINITIDGKGFAQVPIGSFAQVVLPYGNHELILSHRDLFDMSSKHNLTIDKPLQRIVIYPTVGTHYFDSVDEAAPLSGYSEIK